MKYETEFGVGDKVFIVDLLLRAPVGPVVVREVDIYDEGTVKVYYRFGDPDNISLRPSDEVYGTYNEALAQIDDVEWVRNKLKRF